MKLDPLTKSVIVSCVQQIQIRDLNLFFFPIFEPYLTHNVSLLISRYYNMAHIYLHNSISKSNFAKSTEFRIKMAHMALIRFYRHRFFRVIADLTVRLTELAENASTSFWPLHLQDAINLKMVKINVDQH